MVNDEQISLFDMPSAEPSIPSGFDPELIP
ncbi:MAG: uracil-DNA glycosylase, partial [Leptolyngbya sp. ERB_1_2]